MAILHNARIALGKVALGPILLTQARWLRRNALRLPEPEGPRAGVIAGRGQELRLLFVGDSSAAGVGVDRHSDAMPYQASQAVAESTGRPVSWQLVAKSGLNTHEAIEFLRSQPLSPADVVVSALGVNDVTAQTGDRRFIEHYDALMRLLSMRTGASFAIVSGLPPLHVLPAAPQPLRWYLGQCASRLDRALGAFCRAAPGREFISLQWARACDMAADRFHPGREQYREWARMVAAAILRHSREGGNPI